jgi:hypothetical protein
VCKEPQVISRKIIRDSKERLTNKSNYVFFSDKKSNHEGYEILKIDNDTIPHSVKIFVEINFECTEYVPS